jgi:MGT family glycosyltransferase
MNHRTYLATLVDGGGTVPAELGAVRRLLQRGHTVIVVAEESMRAEVEAVGATYRPWTEAPNRPTRRPEHDPYRDWECKTPVQLFQRLLDTQLAGPAAAYAADTMRAIEAHRPHAMISTTFAVGAMVAAEASALPYAVPMPNIYPLPTRGYPPFGSGLRPPRTPVGRALQAVLASVVTRFVDRGLPQLNQVRATYGLPPLRHFWDQLASAEQQLLLTSPAFDFALDCPPGVSYVGPVLDDPGGTGSWTPPKGDHPLVLVGMSSTYQQQGDTLQRVVDALSTLPVHGLLTTGPAIDPESLTPADNVEIVQQAPHNEVLRHAAAVVNHGGHGTVIKSIAAGVPMVVIPHGRDQKDNAVRAEAKGVAVTVRRGASSQRVAQAVRRVLEDPTYGANAKRLAEEVRRDASSDTLVSALEQLPHAKPTRAKSG